MHRYKSTNNFHKKSQICYFDCSDSSSVNCNALCVMIIICLRERISWVDSESERRCGACDASYDILPTGFLTHDWGRLAVTIARTRGRGKSISLCTQVMSLFKELPFCWPTANYFPISGTARQRCFVKGRVSSLRETSSSVYISLSIQGTRHAGERMAFVYGAPYIRYGVKVRQAGEEGSPLWRIHRWSRWRRGASRSNVNGFAAPSFLPPNWRKNGATKWSPCELELLLSPRGSPSSERDNAK